MSRYYKVGDKQLPSCTTIISDCTSSTGWAIPYGANQACDWIIENAKFDTSDGFYYEVEEDELRRKRKDEKDYPANARYAHKHHSKKALDIGSEVHGLIEDYLTYILRHKDGWIWPDGMSDEVENAFRAFWNWSIDNDLKPISLEQTVYGDGWAGTLDFYGYFNDRLYVIDWKSSKAFYPEMRYQVAAYRSTYDIVRVPDKPYVEGCGVLRLDKETGLPKFHDCSKTYESDLAVFNAMVELFYLRHKIIAKRAGR